MRQRTLALGNPLLLALCLALAPVTNVAGTNLLQLWSQRLWSSLTKHDVVERQLKPAGKAKRATCTAGQIADIGGKCVDGYRVNYCQFQRGTFVKSTYSYYGTNFVFILPSPLDAALPPSGQYSVNGNCSFIVNSNCGVERGFTCSSCCYISPYEQSFVNVPCLQDTSKDCNLTYTVNSASCGKPPPAIINTTVCNTCVLGSS